jgi:hypothetical protein
MLMMIPTLKALFPGEPPLFVQMMALQGTVYRELENRRTQQVILGGKNYFIKQHFGVGWGEIFKNLLQLRLPIVSAKNEWLALQRLQELNIPAPTLMAYGCRGYNPATRQSFVLTTELPPHISLEDFCKNWRTELPTVRLKRQLILQVARIARTLHTHGINHRDFYLCHLLLDKSSLTQTPKLYVIDLHRAGLRKQTPERWIIKDLAGLYFSSKDCGLTQRDILRFMKEYRNKTSLHLILTKERAFWQRIKQRGDQLYQQHASN